MYLEIVTPEAVLLRSEVDSVTVPGINGEFQILENHAAVVSVLGKGMIKVDTTSKNIDIKSLSPSFSRDESDKNILLLPVDGGVLELKDNRIIVLAE